MDPRSVRLEACARALLTCWDNFKRSNGNQADAYYLLAKDDRWEDLREALGIEAAPINVFAGDYAFLSNFYDAPIVDMYGKEHPTTEHAFQAAKTTDPEWYERIRGAATPGEAKRLGRQAPMRADWNDVRLEIMHDVNSRKYDKHPTLAAKLKATGTAQLIEGNAWGDKYWGVCDGVGENHLGRILMTIRSHL